MESFQSSSTAEHAAVNRGVPGAAPGSGALQVKYAQLLGMPLGTASAQLKKLVVFDLVKRLELDNCYRCGKLIEVAEELDFDHKEPWRGVSAELFWDLDNIAFSHHKCNIAAGRKPLKKIGPEGTSWCAACRDFKLFAEFGKGERNGLNRYCKSCDSERMRRYDQQNPRFPCPKCRYGMRKICRKCGYELPMAKYMAMRRSEGVQY